MPTSYTTEWHLRFTSGECKHPCEDFHDEGPVEDLGIVLMV